jgi:hypothetical protein
MTGILQSSDIYLELVSSFWSCIREIEQAVRQEGGEDGSDEREY